jgi:hypothetical protein
MNICELAGSNGHDPTASSLSEREICGRHQGSGDCLFFTRTPNQTSVPRISMYIPIGRTSKVTSPISVKKTVRPASSRDAPMPRANRSMLRRILRSYLSRGRFFSMNNFLTGSDRYSRPTPAESIGMKISILPKTRERARASAKHSQPASATILSVRAKRIIRQPVFRSASSADDCCTTYNRRDSNPDSSDAISCFAHNGSCELLHPKRDDPQLASHGWLLSKPSLVPGASRG